MRRVLVVLAVLVGLVLLALSTWGVERFLHGQGGRWNEAIQSVATVALVLVTAAYVLTTYILVTKQHHPLVAVRLAAEEQAVRQFLAVVDIGKLYPLETEILKYPLDESEKPPEPDWLVPSPEVINIEQELGKLLFQLPMQLQIEVNIAELELARGAARALELRLSIQNARADAGGRHPTWQEVQSQWGSGDTEWTAALAGTGFVQGHDALKAVRDTAKRYVLFLPKE